MKQIIGRPAAAPKRSTLSRSSLTCTGNASTAGGSICDSKTSDRLAPGRLQRVLFPSRWSGWFGSCREKISFYAVQVVFTQQQPPVPAERRLTGCRKPNNQIRPKQSGQPKLPELLITPNRIINVCVFLSHELFNLSKRFSKIQTNLRNDFILVSAGLCLALSRLVPIGWWVLLHHVHWWAWEVTLPLPAIPMEWAGCHLWCIISLL